MLILDPVAHDPEAIERASELARWPLPRTVGAVALASSGARTHPDALAGSDAGGAWMLIGDPQAPGREAELRRTLDGALSALGPTVPLREAHRSLRWARQTLRLVERGALP